MREIDPLEHLETASAAGCHGCADEIAKTIDCADGRLIEIRNEKGAGEMSRMMFDEVDLR